MSSALFRSDCPECQAREIEEVWDYFLSETAFPDDEKESISSILKDLPDKETVPLRQFLLEYKLRHGI